MRIQRRLAGMAVLALVLGLTACGGSSTADDPPTTKAPAAEAAKNLAIILYNDDDNTSRRYAQRHIDEALAVCSDLTDAESAADLFAGAIQVVDDRTPGDVDSLEVARQVEAAFTAGVPCRESTVGVVAVLVN